MLRRKSKSQTALTLTDLPVGTFISTEDGYFYVFSNTQRYRFITTRVLDSWNPQRVVVCSELDPAVRKLKSLFKMKFRNGSLLYCQADGKMYLVSQNKLREVNLPTTMSALNLKKSDAVWISVEERNLHEIGEPLN